MAERLKYWWLSVLIYLDFDSTQLIWVSEMIGFANTLSPRHAFDSQNDYIALISPGTPISPHKAAINPDNKIIIM